MNLIEDFLQTLNTLKAAHNFTDQELAKMLGVGATYISQIRIGVKTPSEKLASRLRMVLEKIPASTGSSGSSFLQLRLGTNWRAIPVISWARAGCGIDFEDLCRQIESWVETESRDQNAYGLIVEGDSMEPLIMAGDVVVFAPNSEPRNGDTVVARLNSGEVFLKRFILTGSEGQTVRLESVNPAYAPREFPREDFRFIHPGVDLKRRLRR